jgi:hypothetical protein
MDRKLAMTSGRSLLATTTRAAAAPVFALLFVAGCGGDDTTGPGDDDTGPSVSISSPSDGAAFVEGSTVVFEGTAEDDEDGTLSGDAYTWESDRDGELNTGPTFATDALSVGTHTVTLTATDDAGNSGSASVDVTVEENEPPSASIESPPDDTVYGEGAPVDLEGSATDPQSGDLTGSALTWSSDRDGTIGTGEQDTTFELSAATHVIELVARDPQGLADTVTVSITVEENGQPTAAIDAPADGAAFEEGQSITFEGSGSDPEDGQLTGSSLEWTSDVDGAFGPGETVTTSSLSAGTHTIVLTATDSRSAPASDTVEIDVNGDPEASIAQPSTESIFAEGDAVTLEGSASDPTEGSLSGASLEWSSDRDGTLGTGSTVTTSSLSGGPHTITLTATDSDGNTGSASVPILVESPGFDIRLRFVDEFSESERATIEAAVEPWEAAITGDVSPVFLSTSLAEDCGLAKRGVDDLAIGVEIDDLQGNALAQAGPRAARVDASGDFTTPICGIVTIDSESLDDPQLERIVVHEVGHVLGIGIDPLVGWGSNTTDLSTFDPSFEGPAAESAFDGLGGEAHLSNGVPLANQGGGGTAGAHWREGNLENELMTGFINSGVDNPLSRLSLAALEDIGYEVDLAQADSYELPMPQIAIWEAEADATLSRPASSGENFGVPPGSPLDSAIVAGANNGTWTADPDGERFTGLLRLDAASSLPAGVTVDAVRLVLQVADVDSESPGKDIEVVPVTDAWDEGTVAWDSNLGFGTSVRTFPHDSASGALELSSSALTDLATDWADGMTANHGVAFRAPDAGADPNFSIGFVSRHLLAPLTHPRIEVVAGTGAAVGPALRRAGEPIPLGDDVRKGKIYGVDRSGQVMRVVEIR